MRLLLPTSVGAAFLLCACASVGRPDGGPRDEDPPRYVSSSPAPGELNVSSNKITITFDENVQLDNASTKVIVSPAQRQQPAISSNGHKVTIELRDTLLPNTTYTIDLADAVKDLNEGNFLDGFAMDFSTGPDLDTLRISGIVMEARNLEPAQSMLVGIYSNPADSMLTTTRFERIAKTNQYGQFTIRNLKPGAYRIYAINDLNNDLRWDRTEDIAFFNDTIHPTTEPIMVNDTLTTAAGTDSIATHPGAHYLPDDVLLTWFNEGYAAQYLRNYSRTDRRVLYMEMATKADSLPQLAIIRAGKDTTRRPLADVSVLSRNLTCDTLHYWLTDTNLVRTDSLLVEARYRRVDSLEQLTWQTDTLKFNYKAPKEKKSDKKNKAPQVQTAAASDTSAVNSANPQPKEWFHLKQSGGSSQELNLPAYFTTEEPIREIRRDGLHLQTMPDSTWIDLPTDTIKPLLQLTDSFALHNYQLDYTWQPATKYRLVVDSLAIQGYYGTFTKQESFEFKTLEADEYSNIIFNITGTDAYQAPGIVELLNKQDAVVGTATVQNGSAHLTFVKPGTYYARIYFDTDSSGDYTTGNVAEKRQPEDVYYYPKKITLKKNWDMEQSWNIFEVALDLQKPNDIKKNKPKKSDKDMRDEEDENPEDEEDDEYNTGFNSTQRSSLTNSR
jgi:hypothetical protein